MIRLVNIIAAVALILAAGAAYKVNAQARAALRVERQLAADLAESRAALDVLRAEWAYQNSPNALLNLAAPYAEALGLGPRAPEQLGHPRLLPLKPDADAGAAMAAAAARLEATGRGI